MAFRRFVRYFLSLALLGVSVVAWFQRQALYDWWQLRDYAPPASIVQVADKASFTPQARHVFYVYHPELDSRATFSSHCSAKGEQTIVLGCYVSPVGIYIYDVKDAQLNGVVEVTAAHEMLHAAYDRLSGQEKIHIDQLITQAYAKVKDSRIRANIDTYRKQGADVTNELHSILGTEVRKLPPELEQYYQRYFMNRAQVVSDSEKYESYFTKLQSEYEQLHQALTVLKQQIDTLQNQVDGELVYLNSSRGTVDAHNSSEVNAFNSKVYAYNADVNKLQALIAELNSLIAEQNKILVQTQQLYKAIDSRPTKVQAE